MVWRRRKLPEDDQPLVPHGLISQALDERAPTELPPDMWESSPKDVVQAPAEPALTRLHDPASSPAKSDEIASEPGKISPPMRWPRVDEAEVARRAQHIDAAVSFPFRKPLVSSAVPKTVEPALEPKISAPARLELVTGPHSTPPSPQITSGKVLARWNNLRLRGLSGIWRPVQNTVAQQFEQLRSKSGPPLRAAKLQLVRRSSTAVSQSRSGIERVLARIRLLDMSGAALAWNRVRSFRVTLRIPRSSFNSLASLADRAKDSRGRLQRVLQLDSRLWGSMTMATLSALLALGVISSVRHYEPSRVEAQPAQPGTVHASTSPSVQSGSNVVQKPVALVSEQKPVPMASGTGQASAAKAPVEASNKEAVAPSLKKPVRRNRDEDDYVAKDTYVYYGNSGKRSR